MTFWVLYTALKFPYYFAKQETCDKVGQALVKSYKHKKYKCIQIRK